MTGTTGRGLLLVLLGAALRDGPIRQDGVFAGMALCGDAAAV